VEGSDRHGPAGFVPFNRWSVEIPMKGLGIGQQLGWLTEKLSGELCDR
jgi:hypothetical protein